MRSANEFWNHVRVGEKHECWPWMLSTANGYGQLNWCGKHRTAHRVAFYLANGHWPTPNANHVDACNPLCCNPSHLYEGTNRQNVLDMFRVGKSVTGQQARAAMLRQQTHCKYGHEYTPETTGYHRTGWRYCKTCQYLSSYSRSKTPHSDSRGAALCQQ